MPKIVDHDQKRADLLQGCFGLFAKRGYASITMRAIADALGVSTGTLYHYFKNKDVLFEQMVEHLGQRDVTIAREEIEQAPTPFAKVETLLQFVESNEEHFQQMLLIALDYTRQTKKSAQGSNPVEQIVIRYTEAIEDVLSLEGTGMGKALFSFMAGIICQRLFAGSLGGVADYRGVFQLLAGTIWGQEQSGS